MKKLSLILLSIFFTVSASSAGYCSEASVSTDHWYPGRLPAGYSEYQLELTVRGESISSVTVSGQNVPSTSLKYEKTSDSGEWRWTTSVGLPGKPSVGDTYTFTITYTSSSTEVLHDSVSGTIEEFPNIISPVHASTITTTRPVFKWTALTTKLRSMSIIVADPESGDLLWMGDIPINATSTVYNFDGKGKPLQAGKKYIWLLNYRDEQDDKAAFVMSEFTLSADAAPPTISGNISYTGTATGTIVVAAFPNQQFNNQNPSAMIQLNSPGGYTIPDIADGTYYIASALLTLGMENNIQKTDPWGVYGTWGNPTPVTITGGKGVSGVDITLVDGTDEKPNPFSKEEKQYSTSSNSQNWNNGNNYTVQFSVEDSNHKATSVAVTGPFITGTLLLDYDTNQKCWNSWQANKSLDFGSNPPTPPLTYTFTIIDPESTTVKTDVVESFVKVYATVLSPSKGKTATNPLSFSWTGVGLGYTYQVQLNDANWNRIWDSDKNLTTTSVQYDGTALISGKEYFYWVKVEDTYGNESFAQESFVYHTVGTGSISGTVSYTGSAKGAVVVAAFTNTDFKNSQSATEIKLDSPGSYTISGLSDGTYYIASVLFTLGYTPDTNNTIQKTDPWGVYGTLGNLIAVTITGGGGVSGKDFTLVDGTEEKPNPFYGEGTNGVAENIHPSVFSLSQNFPNPFNPVTTIEFSVPRSERVTLRVFNTLGEEVARLVDGKVTSGSHTIEWNASGFASGLYFYRLEAGSKILMKKLLLLK